MFLLCAAPFLVGCGSDSGEGDDAAVRTTIHRWVDQDDCSAGSDKFLASTYAGESDPRAACERNTLKGIRAGDYSVESVDVEGDTATVVLKLVTDATRTYTLVKNGDGWLVDDLSETSAVQKAPLGKPLEYLDSFELDGRPIDVRLTVTTLSLEPADPPQFYPSHGGSWYRAKARIESDSSAPFYVSVSDFSLVDNRGQRAQGNSAFEPPLGRDSVTLASRDEITGFVGFELPRGSKPTEVRYQHPASQGSPLTWPVD
jgi:hypothetical protein